MNNFYVRVGGSLIFKLIQSNILLKVYQRNIWQIHTYLIITAISACDCYLNDPCQLAPCLIKTTGA
jgi:hypothetical protein